MDNKKHECKFCGNKRKAVIFGESDGQKYYICDSCKQKYKFFLSFVNEAIMNSDYEGYTGGRIEVHKYGDGSPYADGEIRYLTQNREDFFEFRDEFDFAHITLEKLKEVKKIVKENFMEKLEND